MKLKHFTHVTAIITLFALAACNGSSGSGDSSPVATQDVTTAAITEVTKTSVVAEDVRSDEKEDILYMFEEEKLARDIYINMNKKYNAKIFSNISQSEQKHMDSVKKLLDQAGLPTPVDPNQVGVFKDPEIIKLYEELLERGNKSLYDAYRVGLDIEDMDIEDLTKRIPLISDPAIKQVFENLLKGSYSHKEAFEGKL